MALYCRPAMYIGGEALCDIGSKLFWCGGYNFPVSAQGGIPAPRSRVHDKDLVVKRIQRGKSVAGPTPIERLHLRKALWLGVGVVAALFESAAVPPTWRNYRVGEAHSHTGAFPGGAYWPCAADLGFSTIGKHSATSGRCCSSAGGIISLFPQRVEFPRRVRESMLRISLQSGSIAGNPLQDQCRSSAYTYVRRCGLV